MAYSLEQRLGQLFIVGFPGTSPPEELKQLLSQGKVGGIILFKHNIRSIEQANVLCEELHSLTPPDLPLFIAIDQEWGIVNRFPQETITSLPGAMAFGAIADDGPILANRAGVLTGRLLKFVGCNLNYAPVVDLASKAGNPQTKTRCYHHESRRVKELSGQFAEGLLSEGVFPCIKHFPGLGEAEIDTHLGSTEVPITVETFFDREAAPFQCLITRKYPFVMVTHAQFPELCPNNFPASLSPIILRKFLRELLQFDGVIATDDLEMGAITAHLSLEEACQRALSAGCDQLLVCKTPEKLPGLIESLAGYCSSKVLSEEAVEQSFRRIMAAKEHLLDSAFHRSLPDLTSIRRDMDKLARVVARLALTRAAGDESILPLSKGPLAVYAPARLVDGSPEHFPLYHELREQMGGVTITVYDHNGPKTDEPANPEARLLVSHDALFHPQERAYLQNLLSAGGGKSILACMGTPYEAGLLRGHSLAIAAYSSSAVTQSALAEALCAAGNLPGRLPVELPASKAV